MSDLMHRASRAARKALAAHRAPRVVTVDDAEQNRLADEYAAMLGLDLPLDEQRAAFKRHTEGAPLVQRPLRSRLV